MTAPRIAPARWQTAKRCQGVELHAFHDCTTRQVASAGKPITINMLSKAPQNLTFPEKIPNGTAAHHL
jgi:hypothetical protein